MYIIYLSYQLEKAFDLDDHVLRTDECKYIQGSIVLKVESLNLVMTYGGMNESGYKKKEEITSEKVEAVETAIDGSEVY